MFQIIAYTRICGYEVIVWRDYHKYTTEQAALDSLDRNPPTGFATEINFKVVITT